MSRDASGSLNSDLPSSMSSPDSSRHNSGQIIRDSGQISRDSSFNEKMMAQYLSYIDE